MCDETTAIDHEKALAARGLSRRQFAALGGAAALAGCAGTYGNGADGQELIERTARITTEDGIADAFFVHPASGTYPGVIIWPDIAGLREVFRIMARSLAERGHAVLVVNQYYRSQPAPVMESFSEFMEPEGRDKVMGYREKLDPAAITRDARAFVTFLDGEEAVDTSRGIGTQGYCMGGPFTVRTAAAVPARVKAAASFHGGGLVTDEPDSPHRILGQTQASYLFAIARDDDERNPDHKQILRKAAADAGRPAEIEVYPANHGWCVADSPAWDPDAADRAWGRLMALYDGL